MTDPAPPSPTPPVSPQDFFRACLDELGWNNTDFARRTGMTPNTVHRWVRGELPVPKWTTEYLRAMLAMRRMARDFGVDGARC